MESESKKVVEELSSPPSSIPIPPPIPEKDASDAKNTNSQILGGSKHKSRSGCFYASLAISCVLVSTIIAFICIGAVMLFIGSKIDSISSFPSSRQSLAKSFKEQVLSGSFLASNKILVVDVKGIILNGQDRFSEVANADSICEMLEQARNDKNIKALVLRLDTPGGEVIAADKIYKKELELKDEGVKIVSLMESLAASGGYYVAAPSDFIIANKLTLTGSIGVIIQGFNYKGLLEKIGVHTETYKSGPMKDMLDGSKIRTEEEKRIVQNLVEQVYSEFVRIVADGRKEKGLTEDLIRNSEIGDGRIFSGEDAMKLGLVDGLGYYEDAVAKAADLADLENYKVVCYEKKFSFLDIFSEMRTPSSAIKISLPQQKSWTEHIEPGKMYFLPTW